MIDIEELERLAKAAMRCVWGNATEWACACGDRAEGEYIAALDPVAVFQMIAEMRQLREDLQASKLLAHANGEMFRAEKAERERLVDELRTPQYTHVEIGRLGSLWANGLSREAAEEGFMNYPGALVTVYYGRKWAFANMADFDSGPPFPLSTD